MSQELEDLVSKLESKNSELCQGLKKVQTEELKKKSFYQCVPWSLWVPLEGLVVSSIYS